MNEILTPVERRTLLDLARATIDAHLRGVGLKMDDVSPRLQERGGAFVTLRFKETHELRGCIGYIEPLYPLFETVMRAARLAATEDTRFMPVALDELPLLSVEISALDPPRAARPEEVEVGRHGLIIGRHNRRGLLLPQVATEQGWDREMFLAQTCRKAGLPLDAWREPDAEIQVFAATVFGEDSQGATLD